MNHPRLSVLLITALFCCILIPAGTAAEHAALPQNTIILPDSSENIRAQPDWHSMFCALPKEAVICGPDTCTTTGTYILATITTATDADEGFHGVDWAVYARGSNFRGCGVTSLPLFG